MVFLWMQEENVLFSCFCTIMFFLQGSIISIWNLPNHFGSISDHLHVHTACAIGMCHEVDLWEFSLKLQVKAMKSNQLQHMKLSLQCRNAMQKCRKCGFGLLSVSFQKLCSPYPEWLNNLAIALHLVFGQFKLLKAPNILLKSFSCVRLLIKKLYNKAQTSKLFLLFLATGRKRKKLMKTCVKNDH